MADNDEAIPKLVNGELKIARTLDASCEDVFYAWTEGDQVAQWWGPHGFTNPVCDLDPQPGGEILIHMRAPDGTVFPMLGKFVEVVEPERVVFTTQVEDDEGEIALETLVTVTLAEAGPKTAMNVSSKITRSTADAAMMIAGMPEGWSQSIERLEQHLASD